METTNTPDRKTQLVERVNALFKRIANIERAFSILRKEVKDLKWTLTSKDKSISKMAELIDNTISIVTTHNQVYFGTLKWIDKYEIGMLIHDGVDGDKEIIINKGAIISIAKDPITFVNRIS